MKTTAPSAPALCASLTLVVLLAARPAPAAQEGGAGRAAQRVPERGLRLRAEDALEGFTLIAPLRSHDTLLLDMQGEVVHRWTSELPPGNSAYLLDDGTLLRCGREPAAPVFEGGGQGGRVQLLAPDGTLLWDFDYARCGRPEVRPLRIAAQTDRTITCGCVISLRRDPRKSRAATS